MSDIREIPMSEGMSYEEFRRFVCLGGELTTETWNNLGRTLVLRLDHEGQLVLQLRSWNQDFNDRVTQLRSRLRQPPGARPAGPPSTTPSTFSGASPYASEPQVTASNFAPPAGPSAWYRAGYGGRRNYNNRGPRGFWQGSSRASSRAQSFGPGSAAGSVRGGDMASRSGGNAPGRSRGGSGVNSMPVAPRGGHGTGDQAMPSNSAGQGAFRNLQQLVAQTEPQSQSSTQVDEGRKRALDQSDQMEVDGGQTAQMGVSQPSEKSQRVQKPFPEPELPHSWFLQRVNTFPRLHDVYTCHWAWFNELLKRGYTKKFLYTKARACDVQATDESCDIMECPGITQGIVHGLCFVFFALSAALLKWGPNRHIAVRSRQNLVNDAAGMDFETKVCWIYLVRMTPDGWRGTDCQGPDGRDHSSRCARNPQEAEWRLDQHRFAERVHSIWLLEEWATRLCDREGIKSTDQTLAGETVRLLLDPNTDLVPRNTTPEVPLVGELGCKPPAQIGEDLLGGRRDSARGDTRGGDGPAARSNIREDELEDSEDAEDFADVAGTALKFADP